ncbi:tetratricopeptide repeat protein [Pseudomonas aeruginosa]|uniref:tetratricopeptide repeat protein n=1 Tax=Pseudomonas aeruginosa TaxID=287 RepID=UPI00281201B8|nr:tetratricopeptide repeat protein [Pseudomonas aeruginosa]
MAARSGKSRQLWIARHQRSLGSFYEKLGDIDLAIENFGRAIRLQSDYAQAYYNRAHAYVLKQDEERAIADYDKAILLQPTYAEAYVNRAIVKFLLRDVQGALADLDTAIKLNPRDVSARSNRANVNLAIAVHDRPAPVPQTHCRPCERTRACTHLVGWGFPNRYFV